MVNYTKGDPNHPLNELTASSGAFTGLIPNVAFLTSHWVKSEVMGLVSQRLSGGRSKLWEKQPIF